MILFTDEVFINVKKINSVNVGCHSLAGGVLNWFVNIQCMLLGAEEGSVSSPYEYHNGQIACDSKEMAYRIFKEIMRQVSDSDLVPELTSKLVADVLSNEEKV